jgi:hypothetical protein
MAAGLARVVGQVDEAHRDSRFAPQVVQGRVHQRVARVRAGAQRHARRNLPAIELADDRAQRQPREVRVGSAANDRSESRVATFRERAALVGKIDRDPLQRDGRPATRLAESDHRARPVAHDRAVNAPRRLRASDRHAHRLYLQAADHVAIEAARHFPRRIDALAAKRLEPGQNQDRRHRPIAYFRRGCSIGRSSWLPHSAHDPR